MELIKENLESWQKQREELESKKEQLRIHRDAFEEQHKLLIYGISELSSELMEEKSLYEIAAEKDFRQTGNKKLLGGIGIREGILINYDLKDALNWAQDHKLCLTLDKREFDKIAKTQDIDCVTKEHKITVTFPPKLKFE